VKALIDILWGSIDRSDDAADAPSYLVATKSRAVTQRKLRGLYLLSAFGKGAKL